MANFLSWLKLESLQRIKKTQSTWQKCYDRCYLDEFDYNCIYWRFNIKNISTAKYDCKKDWSNCWRVFNCLNTATNLKDIWWPKAISHWYQNKSKQSLFSIHVSTNLYPITVSFPTLPEPKSKSEELLYWKDWMLFTLTNLVATSVICNLTIIPHLVSCL